MCGGNKKKKNKISGVLKLGQLDTAVNAACVDHMSINACWLKDYAFGLVEELVITINKAETMSDIAHKYDAIGEESFPTQGSMLNLSVHALQPSLLARYEQLWREVLEPHPTDFDTFFFDLAVVYPTCAFLFLDA